jgi:trigger factor
MHVTETSNSGLKRELKVIIAADELEGRFSSRLDEVKDQVQLKGFRKGKVPPAHIKKMYGRSLMLEVLQQAVDETSRKAIADRNERAAIQPDIKLSEDKDEIERIIAGKSDLAYTMSFEVLPAIELADFSKLQFERLVADVDDAAIDAAVAQLAERSTTYEDDATRAASDGDRLTIDFVGKIDGVAFDGGTAEAVPLVIGQGGFIPGFEDGLMGAKAGDHRLVQATFPEAYGEASLAGKAATFDVTVKAVAVAKKATIDDEFAKTLGVESLAKLRELVSAQIAGEYAQVSRTKIKRDLLDALDKAHTFTLPESLVASEFDGIWKQATQALERAGKTFADEGKTEEAARAEYRGIAERRVRLGLVIGEIGDKQKIKVGEDELRRALIEQARRYPGQEKFVYEYYEKNPAALTELRAPIFEDKVVDYILGLANPTERKVSREDLLKPIEEPAGAVA